MSQKTDFTFFQKFRFVLATILLLVLLILVIGEIVMRIMDPGLPPPYDGKEKDKVLGWKTKPYYHFKTDNFTDIQNNKYAINLNFTKHGFRKWNETAHDSSAGTIFFVGDSYVECIEGSDDKVFYSIMKDSLPVKIYAYGTAGYGTTQELMILQQYIDSVNPKWVVLETCSNDFIDNYWVMEENASYEVGVTRPYLTLEDKIEYHFPRPWRDHIKEYSLFLNFIITSGRETLIKLNIIKKLPSTEDLMYTKQMDYPPYALSCRMTGNMLKNVKQLVESRGAKLIVVTAGNPYSTTRDMKDICNKEDITIITKTGEEVELHEKKGEAVKCWDKYHLNNNGQKIFAQVLIDYFRTHELNGQQ